MEWDALPGGDRIRRGLEDLAAGRESIEAELVRIGAPRLRRLGLDVPGSWSADESIPEHRLYARLSAADPRRAHSRYNALVRLLVSFERAAR